MNRRAFLSQAGSIVAGAALLLPAKRLQAADAPGTGERMGRIGCTTVCFRTRFPQTRPRGVKPAEPDLTLFDVPALFAERLGVHNVEVWSRHFAERSETYCKKLRSAAEKAGSRIVNVQLDSPPFHLSSADQAARRKCIDATKAWMDLAAACGATSLRANTGGGGKFDVGITGDSFRQLAQHGEKIGVKILIENHGGHSSNPDNVVAIIKAVDSPWCRTLPDFGNMPTKFTQEQRNAFLGKLMPYAHLISAKGMDFDETGKHTTYDIGACVRFAESKGFKGIYSAERWSPKPIPIDDLTATRRIIEILVASL